MKKIFLIGFSVFIITGCTTKVIVKKDNGVYQQKQDANKAWKDLDKEN